MRWRFLAAAVAVMGCTDTGIGVNGDPIEDGSVNVLLLTETGELVEYSAPPLSETRRFDFGSALSPRVQFSLTSRDGGFFAYEVPAMNGGPRTWSFVRYGPDWTEVARKPNSDYIGQDTVYAQGFQLTPDGRFLVSWVPVRTVAGLPPQILVLDAATLDVVRRIDATNEYPFQGGGPDVSSGAEVVMLRSTPGCGVLSWLDVEAGTVTDSINVPCNHSVRGFQTRRRLYVTPIIQAQYTPLLIHDVTTGSIVASQSTEPVSGIVADTAGGRIVGFGVRGAVLMNAQNLAVQGVVETDQDTTDFEDRIRWGFVDPGSGALVADVWGVWTCPSCYRDPTMVAVIDLNRRELVVRQELGTRITVIR